MHRFNLVRSPTQDIARGVQVIVQTFCVQALEPFASNIRLLLRIGSLPAFGGSANCAA